MNGFLKDITYARSGEYILSIYTRESCKDIWKNFGERRSRLPSRKKPILAGFAPTATHGHSLSSSPPG